MKFAAIDIGSNAVRLLFMQVFEYGAETVFKKDALFRVPVRLGEDVFVNQEITPEKADSLVNTMIAFQHLIKAYRPSDTMACATSAMREAINGAKVVKRIKQKTGLDIQIIDGQREADIIYSNHIADRLDPANAYLYIDVGGGSTEITVISGGNIVEACSFNIGTVRLLKNLVSEDTWLDMKSWLKKNCNSYEQLVGIGSGGNINKIFSLSRIKNELPISYTRLMKLYKQLNSISYEDRIRVLGLKPDRADVIIPAARIYTSVMKWSKIKKMYVPQIGLADGIIHLLFEKQKHEALNF